MTRITALALMMVSSAGSLGTAQAATNPGPAAPPLRFVFEELVDLADPEPAGPGPRGAGNRIGLTGGSFAGPQLRGEVVPGGADWQLVRADGCTEIVADYFLRTDDATLIHVRNVGLACDRAGKQGPYLRATPVFTSPTGKYDWLNKAVFTSVITPLPDSDGKVRRVAIRFYEVE